MGPARDFFFLLFFSLGCDMILRLAAPGEDGRLDFYASAGEFHVDCLVLRYLY